MYLKKAFIFSVLVLLVGCRVQIDIPDEGAVRTVSGNYSCDSGETCTVDVMDLLFHEIFIAEPAGGQIFAGWRKKVRGFCGGSLDNCELYTSLFAESQSLMDILASDEVFFLEPTFVGSDSIRVYQVGDTINFSGQLVKAVTGSASESSEVLSRIEFLESDLVFEDKNIVAVRTTITNAETGDELSSSSVHMWQENDGAFFDLNNEYGNYYVGATENVYGVSAITSPLTSLNELELSYYTVIDSLDSASVTSGTRSIQVAEEEAVSVPLGKFSVYPVTKVDEYSFLVDHADYKRNATVKSEETLWVSQAKGIVKKKSVESRYSNIGKLEATVTLELEATATNF